MLNLTVFLYYFFQHIFMPRIQLVVVGWRDLRRRSKKEGIGKYLLTVKRNNLVILCELIRLNSSWLRFWLQYNEVQLYLHFKVNAKRKHVNNRGWEASLARQTAPGPPCFSSDLRKPTVTRSNGALQTQNTELKTKPRALQTPFPRSKKRINENKKAGSPSSVVGVPGLVSERERGRERASLCTVRY